MRRILLLILLVLFLTIRVEANDTISIPLNMLAFNYLPMDGPTGSTPDPTDPNQFRASLVGNTLFIETQKEAVSYVVVQEVQSNGNCEDYFFEISYGSVSCTIKHTGLYIIRIGYWTTDFVGSLRVVRMAVSDFNGRLVAQSHHHWNLLPQGFYFLRVETNLGAATTKFYKRL